MFVIFALILSQNLHSETRQCNKLFMCFSLVTQAIILILQQSKGGEWKDVKQSFRYLSVFHLPTLSFLLFLNMHKFPAVLHFSPNFTFNFLMNS